MAYSVNQVHLLGNVGNDPEVRSTSAGQRVATFSLATTEKWRDKTNGNQQERTQWHRCVVWGKLADIVEQYVHKGDKLYATGGIDYRQWEDKAGNTRYSTEIKVRDITLVGGRADDGGARPSRARGRGLPDPTNVKPAFAKRAPSEEDTGDAFEDFPEALQDQDDDLPF